jgi:hypothetical protein
MSVHGNFWNIPVTAALPSTATPPITPPTIGATDAKEEDPDVEDVSPF